MRNALKIAVLVFVTLPLCGGIGAPAEADIISPSGVGGGNFNNGFPFNNSDPMRYQQVYGSSDFGSSPLTITGMDFTTAPANQSGGAFSGTISNISIFLSTTAAPVDGLSTNYNSNLGANDTQVFGGSLTLSSAGVNGVFDISIPFTTSFVYDPAAGNLLLDVQNFSGASTGQFGFEFAAGDTVSRLF
jgi:hypothetical protein